jgi:hypothetical protein
MSEIPIDKLAEKLGADVEKLARAVKISIFSGVILDTRVRTGRLRGNWQTTTEAPASGTIERFDPSGSQAISDVQNVVKSDTVDYLTNNLPYAPVWNERDGYIQRAVQRIGRTIREQLRR